MCGRLVTYQFYMFYSSHQDLLGNSEFSWLDGVTTLPCDHLYMGCTDSYKERFGARWEQGRTFGRVFDGGRQEDFPSWQPGTWTSFCLTASSEEEMFRLMINQEIVYENLHYPAHHQHSHGDILLMNNNDHKHPLFGAMTDFQVWNRTMTVEELEDWSSCRTESRGNVVDWENTRMTVVGLETLEVEKSSVCHTKTFPMFLTFDFSYRSLDEIKSFCRNVGGEMAVASDSAMLEKMVESFANTRCGPWLYAGYTDRVREGEWRNVLDGSESLNWTNWDVGEPSNGLSSYDCAFINQQKKFDDYFCTDKKCPICRFGRYRTFRLRGVCLDSQVDSFYVLKSSRELLGNSYTKILFDDLTTEWKIVRSSNESEVIAVQHQSSGFPLGRHKWRFISSSSRCRDGEENYRSLNLHIDVQQPGQFCCDDGTCIDSELVCNNNPDCSAKEDEKDCNLIRVPTFSYNKDLPPTERTGRQDGSYTNTEITTDFKILDILDINEKESSIDLYFILSVRWNDIHIRLENLKTEEDKNTLSQKEYLQIWLPRIQFIHSEKEIDFQMEIFVSKNTSARVEMSGQTDEINVKEIYQGSENPLNIVQKKRIRFTCNFDNIAHYPFQDQICRLSFYIPGADNKLTNLRLENFENLGPARFGQYIVKRWNFTNELTRGTNERIITVSVHLAR